MSQELVLSSDGRGRRPVAEILVGTPAVSNLIRENKTHQLQSIMQTGRRLGMQTLDDAIEELLNKRRISPEEAFEKCLTKERFARLLKRVPEEYADLVDARRCDPVGAVYAHRHDRHGLSRSR